MQLAASAKQARKVRMVVTVRCKLERNSCSGKHQHALGGAMNTAHKLLETINDSIRLLLFFGTLNCGPWAPFKHSLQFDRSPVRAPPDGRASTVYHAEPDKQRRVANLFSFCSLLVLQHRVFGHCETVSRCRFRICLYGATMAAIGQVDAAMNFPEAEEDILKLWKQLDAFKVRLRLRTICQLLAG